MTISLRVLSKYEKIPLDLRGEQTEIEMFRVDYQGLVDIMKASYKGEAFTPSFEDETTEKVFKECSNAFFFVSIPLQFQEHPASVFSNKLVPNDVIKVWNLEELKKAKDSFMKEIKEFVQSVSPTIYDFHKLSIRNDSLIFQRLYVSFDKETKIPLFVMNQAYAAGSANSGINSLEFDLNKPTPIVILPTSEFNNSLQTSTSLLVSKDKLFLNGLLKEESGAVSIILRKDLKDISSIFCNYHDNKDAAYDFLKLTAQYPSSQIPIAINSEVFPGNVTKNKSSFIKLPFDKEFFDIILNGVDSSRADEKGLKSVFQPRSSYSPLSVEKPSSRYTIVSTDDKAFFCTMKSSIGKAAQESVRITRGLGNFFIPFFSFAVEQLLMHDMVINQDSWELNRKGSHVAYNGLKNFDNNMDDYYNDDSNDKFLKYFSSEAFNQLIPNAISGESILFENFSLRNNPVSRYLHNHQMNFMNIIYKKDKNILLYNLGHCILGNIYGSFGYREPSGCIAKIAIDNILFTNEDHEKAVNYAFSSKDGNTSVMSDISFPISSLFTLSTESNLIISRLLNCKSATDYYSLLLEEDGKYFKHLETVVEDNHVKTLANKVTDQNATQIRSYTTTVLAGFKAAARTLSSIETKRNTSK